MCKTIDSLTKKAYIYGMKYFPDVQPEIDTVRIYFTIWTKCNLWAFLMEKFQNRIATFQRCSDGSVDTKWEVLRADQKKSWYGKMQVFITYMRFGLSNGYPVLAVEYSVAKWYNVSNAFNCGRLFNSEEILNPIFSQLAKIDFFDYCSLGVSEMIDFMRNHFICRRLDISYNFKCTEDVNQIMRILATCRLNNGNARFNCSVDGQFETVSFGGTCGSSYKAMFYDKFKEQKKFFSLSDYDNSLACLNDRRDFWKRYGHLMKDLVRFECQFKSKFFRYHIENYDSIRDEMQMDKIIFFSRDYWKKILTQFDESMGCVNSRSDEMVDLFSQAIANLESIRLSGGMSQTVYNNLSGIIRDVYSNGLDFVKSRYSQQSFSRYYLQIKRLTGLDLKRECVERLPIMRIMAKSYRSIILSKDNIFQTSHVIRPYCEVV